MSLFELSLIVSLIAVSLSIVWSTLKVGISPMPSSRKARNAIIKLIDDTGNGPVYELGSGWGGLALLLAKRFPKRSIISYEVSFIPWLISVIFQKLLRIDNLKIYRKDFLRADLSEAEVIVCYLHTEGMQQIADKLKDEEQGNCFLISSTFALPGYPIDRSVQINDFYKSPVYRYRLIADMGERN